MSVWAALAAQSASRAARQARNELQRFDAATQLAHAIAVLNGIRKLQTVAAWEKVQDQYGLARQLVIAAREQAVRSALVAHYDQSLTAAIAQLRMIETQVDQCMAQGELPDGARLNRLVSEQADRVSEVLGWLKRSEDA